MQIGGSEGGRRGFTGTSMQLFRWQVPQKPSARLTHRLKLDTVVWLLRCSVLREVPMASAIHFKKLNCYGNSKRPKILCPFLLLQATGHPNVAKNKDCRTNHRQESFKG